MTLLLTDPPLAERTARNRVRLFLRFDLNQSAYGPFCWDTKKIVSR